MKTVKGRLWFFFLRHPKKKKALQHRRNPPLLSFYSVRVITPSPRFLPPSISFLFPSSSWLGLLGLLPLPRNLRPLLSHPRFPHSSLPLADDFRKIKKQNNNNKNRTKEKKKERKDKEENNMTQKPLLIPSSCLNLSNFSFARGFVKMSAI